MLGVTGKVPAPGSELDPPPQPLKATVIATAKVVRLGKVIALDISLPAFILFSA